MFGLISFSLIIIYALIALAFNVTKIEVQGSFPNSLMDIFKVAIPVAISEEFIFKVIIYQYLLLYKLDLNVIPAMIFTSLLFSVSHFWLGIHKTALHKIELFIGLFLFSMITCNLLIYRPTMAFMGFIWGWQNVYWHMGAIYGVQITRSIFKKEKEEDWALWDEGHALVRCWPIWIAMSIFYFVL